MNNPAIRHSFVRVNASTTHLIQYGNKEFKRFIEIDRQLTTADNLDTSNEQPNQSKQDANAIYQRITIVKRVIVFVPGNPGILGVYHDFLVKLYKTIIDPSDRFATTVILGLSHNDFDHPNNCNYESSDRVCFEDNDLNFVERSIAKEHEPYDVEMQVLNKLIILKRLIKLRPNGYRIVFIGHSIGCYIILRLLQDKTIASVHAGSILIHPALENLALTTKGAKISRFFDLKVDLAMKFAAYICEILLPGSFRLSLAKWLCSPEFVDRSSEMVIESIAQLGCHGAVKALVEMARSEFRQVRDIDHKTLIEPHVDKLRLIYAITDGWVNSQNREELRDTYPGLHIEEHQTLHAFMMDPAIMEDYAMKVGMLVLDFFD